MLRAIDNKPHLSFNATVNVLGVSEGYLKRALAGNRKGELKAWDHVKDGREVWINYESLKPAYQKLVQHQYGDPYEYCAATVIQPLLKNNPADVAVLKSFTLPTGEGLPPEKKADYKKACQYLNLLANTSTRKIKSLGFPNAKTFYQAIISIIKAEGISLPGSYSKLRAKVRDYKKQGATCVISKKFGNDNSKKRTPEVEAWLISRYAMPDRIDVELMAQEYELARAAKGWPQLSASAIKEFLHSPDTVQLWYMGRHGETAYKAKFGDRLTLQLPHYRDAMWCSDGTKLDLWYFDKNTPGNMAAKLNFYVVIDVFSECILGWHADEAAESSDMIYRASKMALQHAEHKPYQWLYDGQGGHKLMKQFFDNAVAGAHFASRPRSPQGKSVEQLFNRFQQQVLKKLWFSTGQSIKSRREDSHANMDFIKQHKDRLPTKAQVLAMLPAIIQEWNQKEHHKHKQPRQELYRNSTNPQPVRLELWDHADLFWNTTREPVTYRQGGIQIQFGGEQYKFKVLGDDNLPDQEFLLKNISAKFFVKYDPEDLSQVMLYDKQMRYVATAQPVEKAARAIVDQQPGDRDRIHDLIAVRDKQYQAVKERLEGMRENSGMDPERLLQLNYDGGYKAQVGSINEQSLEPVEVNDAYDGLDELPDLERWRKDDE